MIPVTSWSLYNFKVVQYRHDVLRHEDISCVQGHPHDGNQHGIEHSPLPRLQHVERRDQQVLVVEPGHLLPGPRQRHPGQTATRVAAERQSVRDLKFSK